MRISIARKRHVAAVAISDNGPGMAEADVPRIFDRFYRAQNGEEARAESSGLGLAIAKRITDLHETQIAAVGRPNAGARLKFGLLTAQAA